MPDRLKKRSAQLARLTIQECHSLYPLLLQNGERHLNAARQIAEIEEYGLANAHLIIAAEDYMHALSVYLKGWGMPVSQIKNLAAFYNEKDDGYSISPLIVIMGTFLKTLFKTFDTLTRSLLTLNVFNFRKVFDKNLNPIHLVGQSKKYSDWWGNMKGSKEKGLYVDFDIETSTPELFSSKDYELSLQIVKQMRSDCFATIDFTKKIPEKRRKQFFKWLKNYYEPFMKRLDSFPFNVITKK